MAVTGDTGNIEDSVAKATATLAVRQRSSEPRARAGHAAGMSNSPLSVRKETRLPKVSISTTLRLAALLEHFSRAEDLRGCAACCWSSAAPPPTATTTSSFDLQPFTSPAVGLLRQGDAHGLSGADVGDGHRPPRPRRRHLDDDA